jgi:type III pantothenate kinase
MKAKLLAIDAGNTLIKWGLHDGVGWLSHGSIETARHQQLASALETTLAETIVVCNVAGKDVEASIAAQLKSNVARFHIIRSLAAQCGVVSSYRDPAQLGADRWAALLAAHAGAPGPKVVVMAGTAMTIDALAADGRFLGGVIVPGLALMRSALHSGTAQLGPDPGQFDGFPKNTADAITSGAIQASAGAIARMHTALSETAGSPVTCILSGGAAAALAPQLPFVARVEHNLVLEGLVIIAKEIFH